MRRAATAVVRILLCYVLVFTTAGPAAPRTTSSSSAATTSKPVPGVRPAPQTPSPAQSAALWRDGELLVRFARDAPQRAVNELLASEDLQRGAALRGGSRVERLRLTGGKDPQAAAALLGQSPLVELAEPNAVIKADQAAPNDPRFPEQWALSNPNTPGADIGAARTWPAVRGNPSTVVAVIDSGVDSSHADLRRNQWLNVKESSTTEDADGDGYAGDRRGWDFVTNSPAITDGSGHGTAVAGIIAAEGNNGVGVTGVMWRARLMSLRVLDSDKIGDVASAVEAIDYAVAHGAAVVNCSWGTSLPSAALKDAVERAGRAGALVVASAGNDSQDTDSAPHYPASFDLPNLVSVAATDESDALAPFSNWGARRAMIAAPGARILSTKSGGGYDFMNGTSAAAALVSGVAGLFKSLSSDLTGAQLKSAITSGVRQVPALAGKVASGGVVSAPLALEAAGRFVEENLARERGDSGNTNGGARARHRQRQRRAQLSHAVAALAHARDSRPPQHRRRAHPRARPAARPRPRPVARPRRAARALGL